MGITNSDGAGGPAAELTPILKSSVSDAIVDQLIELISRGVLNPGDRLPSERELCRKFGVGRTSVREALRSLSVMGILKGRVGHGTFVADNETYLERTFEWGLALDPRQVDDLAETRLMLESNTASWAAERATDENLDAIGSTLRGMEQTISEPEEFLKFDVRFHLEVARASQNSILHNLVRMTRHYLQVSIKMNLQTPGSRAGKRARLSVRQHAAVFEAIGRQDPEAARQKMREHVLSSIGDLQIHLKAADRRDSQGSASRP